MNQPQSELKGSKHVDPTEGLIATQLSGELTMKMLTIGKLTGMPINVTVYVAAMSLAGILAEQNKVFTKEGHTIRLVDEIIDMATKLLHDHEKPASPQPSNN